MAWPVDPATVRNPPARFRAAPFWSWNGSLNIQQLRRQIDLLKCMGFGGFHIHSRTGLATEYLGKDFLQAVRHCVAHAKRRRLLVWLYDEDRWPSGFAGGIVTRESRFRARRLRWTTSAVNERPGAKLLAAYSVQLHGQTRPTDWYAWLESPEPDPWFNGQTNIDVMNPSAVRRFIQVTHEAYRRVVGPAFGSTIPAIFTDEPQLTKKMTLGRASDTTDVLIPFSDDFPQTYRQTYGEDLLEHLPKLFWDYADGSHLPTRYRYHDHTAERFASAFGDQIARWCVRHRLMLTGHMLSEATLFGQTRAVGEVMRAMRSFQLPGIDILEDRIELTTAKQAQSLVRQLKRPGMLSELYGVTNWDFDFAGHKRQGDWQAACGVTVRVPHLAWMSMAGEAKRDYPAPIDYHSPWFEEYRLIENHFARLNTVLTRGRPLVHVAVIHPIESFWLHFGPAEHHAKQWEQCESEFQELTRWLAFGLIDFDFVSEALLTRQPARVHAGAARPWFRVGAMRYHAVILPNLRTIRSTTLRQLEAFGRTGGQVIVAGEHPRLIDATPADAFRRLPDGWSRIPLTRAAILDRLEPLRELDIRQCDGGPVHTLLHQIRVEGASRHVFVCNTSRDSTIANATMLFRGRWDVTELDTLAGTSRRRPAQYINGRTAVTQTFHPHGHLLLTLAPAKSRSATTPKPSIPSWRQVARLCGPVPVTLSEPNVLLLDQAAWRIDSGRWQPREEILRIDNAVRRHFKLPERGGRMAQPWTDGAPAPVIGRVQLRFDFGSETHVKSARLAMEGARAASVRLDGREVKSAIVGWWVDESIETIALPPMTPGRHDLVVTVPFSRKTNLEWIYLLGEFGVQVMGSTAVLIPRPRCLHFGDWTGQGLPFYAGNVTYHCQLPVGGRVMIEVSRFRNPLLSVELNGRPAGKIAFAPYQLDLGQVPDHRSLAITAYGNRVNAFGPMHHTNEKLTWVGPSAWRSQGRDWSYEYQLKPMGILAAPIVYQRV